MDNRGFEQCGSAIVAVSLLLCIVSFHVLSYLHMYTLIDMHIFLCNFFEVYVGLQIVYS